MELTGSVKFKSDIQQKSDKFKMIEVVISETSNSQYPQHILFQAVNDRCSILDDIHIGDTVNIQFNIKGRQWSSPAGEVKYFNTLEIWKVQKISAVSAEEKNNYSAPVTVIDTGTNTVVNSGGEIDQLPF